MASSDLPPYAAVQAESYWERIVSTAMMDGYGTMEIHLERMPQLAEVGVDFPAEGFIRLT